MTYHPLFHSDEEADEEVEKASLVFEISTDVAYAGSKATGYV